MYRLILIALFGACGFSNEAPPDAPNTLTVGFAGATSMADEKSSGHPIDVVLSAMHETDVVVTYEVTGGSATPGMDFDTSVASVTIPAGMVKATIIINIKPDVIEEPEETIELTLSSASGATIPAATKNHEVKILAKALPRASFGVATTMLQEPMDPVINVTLDEASEFEITVSYTVTAMGASSLDYTLADGSVMFAAGELSRGVPLDILDDDLDEDPESIEITLTTATNAFVETTASTATHTILDDLVDPPPTVDFTLASSSIDEAGGTANIQLELSALSGRTITVPFTVDAASSATGTQDYTIASMMVTILPGQMTANAQVTIIDDTIDDEAEILELDLAPATNATIQGTTTHQLTIIDNDDFCLGANADIDVCFATAPTGNVTVNGTINTDGASCATTQPIGWTPTQDPVCVIAGANVSVNGATTVTGSRPLVLFATTNLTVSANLNAASQQGGNVGPGTSPATCASTGPENDTDAAGGGAGGSFLTLGGNGGSGDNTDADGGMAAAAVAAPTKLRPGCPGQKGGNSMASQGGAGGGAGGALYLLAGGTLSVGNNIVVNVSGAGGSPSNPKTGGGGGGSGGMLVLFSGTTQALGNATVLVANGGGGSGGGTAGNGGSAGQDPLNPSAYNAPASGGASGGAGAGDGGSGFSIGTGNGADAGDPGSANNAGGGGGGGGGYILSNRDFGNADVSAGLITPP